MPKPKTKETRVCENCNSELAEDEDELCDRCNDPAAWEVK